MPRYDDDRPRPQRSALRREPISIELPGHECFGCALENPYGLQLEFFKLGTKVVAECKPPKHLQGWIGMVHGGILALLLDELAVWTVAGLQRRLGVTRDLQLRYLRPVYLDDTITLAGVVAREKGNLVTVQGTLTNGRQELCTEGEATVFLLDEHQMARMLPDGRVPSSLKPYFLAAPKR